MPKRHRSKDESSEKKHKTKKKHSKKHKRHHGDKKGRRQELEGGQGSGSNLEIEEQEVKEETHRFPEAQVMSSGQMPRQPIGPQLPSELDMEPMPAAPPETKPGKVARGPERPPQEMLDLTLEQSDEPMVGPMPPEIEMEVENETEDSKSREVARVMKLVNANSFVDPFHILDLNKDTGDSDVKKRYWKLSLMVHPDKCQHPMAQKAFQAVNDAFKSLGSAAGRALIQEKKDDVHLQKVAELQAERRQRQHEWAVVLGDADAIKMSQGPQTRQTWMTELPPERRKPTVALQVNKSTFSQKGIRERGDTSAWTNTPTFRASPLSIGPRTYGEPQKPPVGGPVDPERLKKRSLVDQHLEKLKDSKKAKKKSGSKQGASESGGFKGWRPFDRERDLQIPRDKTKDWDTVVKDAQSLSRRFQ